MLFIYRITERLASNAQFDRKNWEVCLPSIWGLGTHSGIGAVAYVRTARITGRLMLTFGLTTWKGAECPAWH